MFNKKRKKRHLSGPYLSSKIFATSEFDFRPFASLNAFQRSISSPILILALLLFESSTFFFLFFAEFVKVCGLPGRLFEVLLSDILILGNNATATARTLGSKKRSHEYYNKM